MSQQQFYSVIVPSHRLLQLLPTSVLLPFLNRPVSSLRNVSNRVLTEGQWTNSSRCGDRIMKGWGIHYWQNPKFQSSLLNTIRRQYDPFHILRTCFPHIHFTLSSHFLLGLPNNIVSLQYYIRIYFSPSNPLVCYNTPSSIWIYNLISLYASCLRVPSVWTSCCHHVTASEYRIRMSLVCLSG
jgi:hypothetical protein